MANKPMILCSVWLDIVMQITISRRHTSIRMTKIKKPKILNADEVENKLDHSNFVGKNVNWDRHIEKTV